MYDRQTIKIECILCFIDILVRVFPEVQRGLGRRVALSFYLKGIFDQPTFFPFNPFLHIYSIYQDLHVNFFDFKIDGISLKIVFLAQLPIIHSFKF